VTISKSPGDFLYIQHILSQTISKVFESGAIGALLTLLLKDEQSFEILLGCLLALRYLFIILKLESKNFSCQLLRTQFAASCSQLVKSVGRLITIFTQVNELTI